MFDVNYSNQTKRFLKKADNIVARRILEKIEGLVNDPIIHDTKRVEGYTEKLFRVRVGDYRILYEVDYATKKIGIVKIDKRGRVY